MNRLAHEGEYRGAETMHRLETLSVTLCGAGALGSNLADSLVRQGIKRLRVIDRDRVEESNLGTQSFGLNEVGTPKVEALRNRLFRMTGVEIEAVAQELKPTNVRKHLSGSDLVLDLFDNSSSRALVQHGVRELQLPCLHVGLNTHYAEILWDEEYRIPADMPGDACVYPLARNLILLAVSVAAETLIQYVITGEKSGWTITLNDLAIRSVT